MSEKNLIWLAGYPKSGTTWLREIISLIVAPELDSKVAIPSFGKAFPTDTVLHNIGNRQVSIVRTHLHADSNRLSQCKLNNVGIITIYRHPLDVLLSAMNFSNIRKLDQYFKNNEPKSVEEIIQDGDIGYYIDKFIENNGIELYQSSSGPWPSYQEGWKRIGEKIPYLSLQYENLVANPLQGISQLCEFLGIASNPSFVQSVYELSERRTALDGEFFWKKRAYNFKEMIPASIVYQFNQKFKKQLVQLGYGHTIEHEYLD
jgi:hypothetical protein